MQLRQQIPAVWVYTTGDAFNTTSGSDGLKFLTDAERARVERLRQARMLYRGEHKQYFLHEGRTQFDFPEILVRGSRHRLYLPLNALRLISLKSADLLFGQEPLVRVDDDNQQAALSAIAERTNLHKRLYNAAVDCSYEAETFLESCRLNGEAYIRVMDCSEMFPQGDVGPDDQYEVYIRRQLETLPGTGGGTGARAIYLLLETTYRAGSIERHLWQLGDHGEKVLELALDNWPHKPIDGTALIPEEKTGASENTITWIPNATDHGQVVSDYDGLIEEQDALNEANTRMKRVLYKHGNPKIFFPTGAADSQGNVRANDDAYYGSPDEKPDYITWDAQLDAASKDRSFTLSLLCIKAETSPVLLGLKEGAAPDAYKKLRLEAMNALTKAQRKATNWKPGIRRALAIARDLEESTPGVLVYAGDASGAEGLAVEMRDGIPIDELDQANTLNVLTAGKQILSTRNAAERLLGDVGAVEKNEQELKEEQAAATPTVLLRSPSGAPPQNAPAASAPQDGLAQEAA